ncbi:hypothetical protein E4U24_008245 [Claviceps purpurea]|nr:hypothetical protein E4U24_008245 [Claviceps purpurea]KAG6314371.1 hypothetical protein E4U44_001902 [Claviceps purpurea]
MTVRMVRARKSKLSMTISHDIEDEDEHKDELLDNATMIVIGEYAAIEVADQHHSMTTFHGSGIRD